MKVRKTDLALLIIFVLGLSMFTYYLWKQESRQQKQELMDNGQQLINLLSLYPEHELQGPRRDFLLRTIVQSISARNLAYLLVHDASGRATISLSPREIVARIPEEVTRKSLFSSGFIQQSFRSQELGTTVYEFAKPIFQNDTQAGMIRLGLKQPSVRIFTAEHVTLLGIIAFFLVLTILISHVGISRELKTLKPLSATDHQFEADAQLDSGQCFPFIENLKDSLTAMNLRLNNLETQNVDLASKIEVNTFEKAQIMSILDSVQLGFVVMDMQDQVTHVNRYGLSLMGRLYDDVIDMPIAQVLPNEDILSFLGGGRPHSEGSGLESKVEATFPDVAPEKTFQVAFSYLNDKDDEPIGKILIIENITSQKLAESAKGEFIAHVAHELLTPMTNIKSYNEMLMNNEVDDEELRIEFFNTINNEIDRLNGLVSNLLSISKIELGNIVINKGLVKSDALVQECLKSIEAAALEKQISLETDFPDNFPYLFVDKELFRISLINIIGNSLKYTPENGQITFSLHERNGHVVFEISDTGYGISPEDLPHVFDKFYRSEQDHITAEQGSGLGLALASEIIQLHDGRIDIQSEVNKGTQVSLSLPKESYHLGKS